MHKSVAFNGMALRVISTLMTSGDVGAEDYQADSGQGEVLVHVSSALPEGIGLTMWPGVTRVNSTLS